MSVCGYCREGCDFSFFSIFCVWGGEASLSIGGRPFACPLTGVPATLPTRATLPTPCRCTRVLQMRTLRCVAVENFRCGKCSLRGWADDNWRDDWVFNYNNNLFLELPVLYDIREALRLGTPIATHLRQFFAPTLADTVWLRENPILARR